MARKRALVALAAILIVLALTMIYFSGLLARSGPPRNLPPSAVLDFTPEKPSSRTRVDFDGSRSSDVDGRIVSFAWAFGDGATATGEKAAHAFASAGTYAVRLTVTDDRGASDSESAEITVVDPPASCSSAPASPTGLLATGKSDSSISFSWEVPAPVERCTLRSFAIFRDYVLVATNQPDKVRHTSTGLTPSMTFLFEVTATNERGESPRSAPLRVATGAVLARGPAAELLIDCSVHTGKAWDGSKYCGVWGETLNFRMADHPVTWAISLVHASALLHSRNVSYSPDAVLSVAIKESRLECPLPTFPNRDGCFQIENTTAYAELRGLWPERFAAPHSQVIEGARFETSALASVHYILFSLGMFHLNSDDPWGYFERHPDPRAMQKVLNGAYNRGLWWTGLKNVFDNCRERDPVECFENHTVAVDHAQAIVNYTKGLEKSRPFDGTLTRADLEQYWERVRVLYPNVTDAEVAKAIDIALEGAGSGPFQEVAYRFVPALIAALPPLPQHEEVIAKLCEKSYLTKSPPCG